MTSDSLSELADSFCALIIVLKTIDADYLVEIFFQFYSSKSHHTLYLRNKAHSLVDFMEGRKIWGINDSAQRFVPYIGPA